MTRTEYLKAVEAGFRRAAAEWVDDAAMAIVEASANDDLTDVTSAGSEEEAYVLTIVTDKRGGRA